MTTCNGCSRDFPDNQMADVHEVNASGTLSTRTLCEACADAHVRGKARVEIARDRGAREHRPWWKVW